VVVVIVVVVVVVAVSAPPPLPSVGFATRSGVQRAKKLTLILIVGKMFVTSSLMSCARNGS
jgi:hypothetical protein